MTFIVVVNKTQLSTRSLCSHLEWFQTALHPATHKHTVLCISGNPAKEGVWDYAFVRIYCTDPLLQALCMCVMMCMHTNADQIRATG